MGQRVGRHAGGVLRSDDPLVGRLVGECRAGDEVADRVDALARRALRAVDGDQPAIVERDPGSIESERRDIGPAPGAITSQSTVTSPRRSVNETLSSCSRGR